MTERPHPDMNRVRDAMRDRDESVPQEEAPQPETEEDEAQDDDGDA